MPLAPGDRFDRYVIASLLGKGGMGEVYRAQDTRLHRAVALKIVRREDPSAGTDGRLSTEGAARLLREGRAVAALDHPNAVAIFDVGDHDGVPFLAMEFIAGKTLRKYVGDPVIPIERRIRWLVDIARGLGAAHRRGLVHRDVKPENVMIREDGAVKVLDFGIARSVSAPVDPTAATGSHALETLTQIGVVVGTPLYMAPEHMRGERIDGRADQFSWGVVAYELLTGETPWKASASSLQLLSQILSKEPAPLRGLGGTMPEEVGAVVVRALAKAPAARFATMEEALAHLEPYASPSIEVPGQAPGGRPSTRPSVPSTKTQLASPPTAPAPSSRGRLGRSLIGAAALVAAAAFVLLLRRVPAERAPASAIDAAAPATMLAWTDTGSPPSPNAEAQGTYGTGMQAARDASIERARANLERATALDPTFAAAHLRAALLADAIDEVGAGVRTHVQKAVQLRLLLSDHDRALLDAIVPLTHAPAEFVESRRRFEALANRWRDADSWFFAGVASERARDHERAIAAIDEALRVDPGLAIALRVRARAEIGRGDVAAATKTYDECLRVSPAATLCLEDRYERASRAGLCDGTEPIARRLIALDQRSPSGYIRLASALAASGQPIEAVRMATEQAWHQMPEPERAVAQLSGETTLALLTGDLRAAARHAEAWDAAIASVSDEREHATEARLRMLAALEVGDAAGAAKIADDYVKERAAWTADDAVEDPAIFALQAAYHAKAVGYDAMAAERSSWIAREADRASRLGRAAGSGRVWVLAYAEMAATPGDAKAALEALPAYLPLDPAAGDDEENDAIGATYLLGADPASALPYLERAAASCAIFVEPIPHVHAWLHLGMAREARGDTSGACAAYAKVTGAWGSQRSVTVDEAHARTRALKCPR